MLAANTRFVGDYLTAPPLNLTDFWYCLNAKKKIYITVKNITPLGRTISGLLTNL